MEEGRENTEHEWGEQGDEEKNEEGESYKK